MPGSYRREVSRGVNLPEVLTIRHQAYVDSATKKPGVRSLIRLDRYVTGSDGNPVAVGCHLVVTTPSDALIVSADVLAAITRITTVLSTAANNGLELASAFAINREQ